MHINPWQKEKKKIIKPWPRRSWNEQHCGSDQFDSRGCPPSPEGIRSTSGDRNWDVLSPANTFCEHQKSFSCSTTAQHQYGCILAILSSPCSQQHSMQCGAQRFAFSGAEKYTNKGVFCSSGALCDEYQSCSFSWYCASQPLHTEVWAEYAS